jgi:hypothetical protein
MTIEHVTLVAALIAAVCSIASVGITSWQNRSLNSRNAHRELLASILPDLGQALHQCMACSSIIADRMVTGQEQKGWQARASEAKTKLKELRWRVRYPLWGLDEHIRTIALVPDWVNQLQHDPSKAVKLATSADCLAKSLDEAIRRSYSNGQPPTWLALHRVKRAANRLKSLRGDLRIPDSIG